MFFSRLRKKMAFKKERLEAKRFAMYFKSFFDKMPFSVCKNANRM